jgi:hypothetical protein
MDTPDLFPGLTREDRARIAQIAGNLESLPALLDRLAGFTAAIEKVRASTPSLMLPRGPSQDFEPLQVVPLTSDQRGYLRVRTRRTVIPFGSFVIKSGQQDGVAMVNPIIGPLVPGGSLTFEDVGLGLIIFDDPLRTESVNFQSSLDGGTTYWNLGVNVFTGAFNSGSAQNALSISGLIGTHLRMRATAAPVGADRTFRLFAFSQ